MPKKVFHAINAQRELDGENLLANPRNGGCGLLRQQDPKVAAKRRLDVQIFNIQLMEGRGALESDSAALDWLESLRFKVIPRTLCRTGRRSWSRSTGWGTTERTLPSTSTGPASSWTIWRPGGVRQHRQIPRWAAAYKYPPEQKPSVVQDIVSRWAAPGC